MRAWHFTGDKLRDGRPVPADGEVLRHDGPIEWCKSGLYASSRIIDALEYTPGNTICRVECADIVQYDDEKFVCRERTILWRVDGTELLREFARRCALDVIHLWDAPGVTVRYLRTGDESIRADALDGTNGACHTRTVWDAAEHAATWTSRYACHGRTGRAIDATWASRYACTAAWAKSDIARKKQNCRLTSMVAAEHRRSK